MFCNDLEKKKGGGECGMWGGHGDLVYPKGNDNQTKPLATLQR